MSSVVDARRRPLAMLLSAGLAYAGIAVAAAPAQAQGLPAQVVLDASTFPRTEPGKRVTLSGRVLDSAGQAVAVGTPVGAVGRVVGVESDAFRSLAVARTGSDGAFRMRFRLRTSLDVAVGGGSGPPELWTARADARLRTRLLVRLRGPRRLRGDRPVTLNGRVRGAQGALEGTRIGIDTRVNGRWQQIGTAPLRSDGRFRWRHRFRRTQVTTAYQFRAFLARPNVSWPWPQKASRRISVLVPGRGDG